MPLRERCGEADRGLTAAPPLWCRLDGDARQPGRQDVLVAPLSAVNIEIVENQAVRAAVAATLDDLREAMDTFEDAGRIARRVLGGSHPLVAQMQDDLRNARYVLRAREAREN